MAKPITSTKLISLKDKAYELIKEAIISNHLKPGEVISENSLAQTLKIGRTPVREALHNLEREGLVEIVPGRGTFISRVSLEDVLEIYHIREAVEGIAARLAAPLIDLVKLEEIEVLFASLEAAKKKDLKAMQEVGKELHSLILEAARSKRIIQIVNMLNDQIKRVFSLSTTVPGRIERSFEEHKKIIQALKKRDAILAEKLMREHIASTRESVLKIL